MGQDPDLNTRIEELAERLQAVEARLAAIEGTPRPEAANGPLPATSVATALGAAPAELDLPTGLVPLLGRALLVLGGGYLLRATADTGAVPGMAAAILGLAYAGFWLARCGAEAARPGARASATFHGVSALAIAYPLILENTLRFHAFDAWGGAALLLAAQAFALHVGLGHGLALVSWTSTVGAVGAAFVLLIGSRDLLPVTLGLLAMAALVERQTGPERAAGLRWPAALGATLAVALTTTIAARAGGVPETYAPLPAAPLAATALLLSALYVVSSTVRTLIRNQALGVFELLQTTLALIVGFSGAARVLAAAGIPAWPLGAAALVLGAGCYLAAFAVIDRRAGQAHAFYAYTTLGGWLALAGWLSVAQGGLLVAAFSLLGLAAVVLGARSGRQTLQVHGALYLLAGAASAGLLGAATDGLLAPASAAWRSSGAAGWLAVVAAALGYGVFVTSGADRTGLAPRLLLVAGLGWSLVGVVASGLARWLAGAGGPSPDHALTGAVRMGVVSAVAVGLAWAARRHVLRELSFIVPAILVGAGFKLLFEDFRHGRPITLFLALAFYGGALLAVPRLRARER